MTQVRDINNRSWLIQRIRLRFIGYGILGLLLSPFVLIGVILYVRQLLYPPLSLKHVLVLL